MKQLASPLFLHGAYAFALKHTKSNDCYHHLSLISIVVAGRQIKSLVHAIWLIRINNIASYAYKGILNEWLIIKDFLVSVYLSIYISIAIHH